MSASGDATLRIVANGDAAALNTDLLTNYADLAPFLKEKAWNTRRRHRVRGAARLGCEPPDVERGRRHARARLLGRRVRSELAVQGEGHGVRLADLHRRRGPVPLEDQPDLKITDPYALDQKQFDAAIALLKQQKANVGEYWSDYLKEQEAFTKGSLVLGTTWQVITNGVQADHRVAAGERDHPQRRLHRVVGQLDGLQQDRSPQLLVRVAELDHEARTCKRRLRSTSVKRPPT